MVTGSTDVLVTATVKSTGPPCSGMEPTAADFTTRIVGVGATLVNVQTTSSPGPTFTDDGCPRRCRSRRRASSGWGPAR
jgi:hypothetical protein